MPCCTDSTAIGTARNTRDCPWDVPPQKSGSPSIRLTRSPTTRWIFSQRHGAPRTNRGFCLAYNSPHFPLHAPKDLIDKYQKVYEQGWDAIRDQRFARMKKLGLIDPRWKMSPRS